jgi:hypothetical protein
MVYLSVFGTLKKGFPLHHHLEGALFQGAGGQPSGFPSSWLVNSMRQ